MGSNWKYWENVVPVLICESAKHGIWERNLILQFINNYNYSIYNNNRIYQNAGRLSLFEKNGIFSISKHGP